MHGPGREVIASDPIHLLADRRAVQAYARAHVHRKRNRCCKGAGGREWCVQAVRLGRTRSVDLIDLARNEGAQTPVKLDVLLAGGITHGTQDLRSGSGN